MREKYDLVVAGGGPAGVAAAVAAGRNGLNVLLVEQAGYLGGMATNGGVPAFCPFTDGEKVIIKGIGFEILEQLKERSYVSPFYDRKSDRIEGIDWLPIDSEALKLVLDEMILAGGCDVLFHTIVIGAECQDDRLEKVQLFNKSGRIVVDADYFADCTGDGDLVEMAGREYEYGDEEGLIQASTLCFKIANFDTDRFMAYAKAVGEDGNLSVASAKAKADGVFPEGEKHVAGIALFAAGMAAFNFGHVFGCSSVSGTDLTRAELEGRKRLPELMAFIHQYVPGGERAVLAASGPHIGIRESRRIVGEYQMTTEDYFNRQDYPDGIAYYSYPIDMHGAKAGGESKAAAEQLYQTSKYKNGECYGIPYRALLPKGMKNLITAGRIISADRGMMASVRVMPACFATGQAAGTAVALAAAQKLDLGAVSGNQLRETLKAQGAYIRE